MRDDSPLTPTDGGIELLPDYYAALGIAPDASVESVRRAYRDQAQAAMADRAQFEILTEAFNTLKDVSRRAAYDRRLRLEAVSAGGTETESDRKTVDSFDRTIAAEPTAMGAAMTVTGGSNPAGERTVALPAGGFVPGSDKTQGFALAPCPICQTMAVPGERYCLECGFLVGSTPGDTLAQRPLPRLLDESRREFPLHAGENIVGRDGADVMLPDKTVSRRHARIVVEADGIVWLEDTGSTNGTKRGGAPVAPNQRVSLSDGTQILFGSVKMTISIPPAADGARLALPAPGATGTERAPIAALNAPVGSAPTALRIAELRGKDGTVITINGSATFGRKSSNTVVMANDSFISGSHAQIVLENDNYTLTDLGSTNGTKLNGRKLPPNEKMVLQDGDEIMMGQTPFLFSCPPRN